MPANNVKIKPSQYQEIKALLSQKTNKEIAKIYNVNQETIGRICKILGIKKGRPFKHTKDESYFESINSHEKAYILGIMYSDGWVKRNWSFGVSLKAKDKDILFFIKDQIKFSGEVKQLPSRIKKDQLIIEISSKKMCEDLHRIGCVPAKSLILEWPKFLENSEYIWSFLLGVLDGDGCPFSRKGKIGCSITGSSKFCFGLQSFLIKNGISANIKNYPNPLTKDCIMHGRNAVQFFKLLISNQKFSLKRKRDIMEYCIYCHDKLRASNSRIMRGTFLKEAFLLFKEGKFNELDEFVNLYHKETYKKQGEKAKTTWVNQFTSAKQKSLDNILKQL